jgi:hypothetical protein
MIVSYFSAVNRALWNGGSERKAWTDGGRETAMANDPDQTLTAYHARGQAVVARRAPFGT